MARKTFISRGRSGFTDPNAVTTSGSPDSTGYPQNGASCNAASPNGATPNDGLLSSSTHNRGNIAGSKGAIVWGGLGATRRFADFVDGTSNSILAGEKSLPWQVFGTDGGDSVKFTVSPDTFRKLAVIDDGGTSP